MSDRLSSRRSLLKAGGLAVASLGVAGALVGGAPGAPPEEKEERHPRIHAAIRELREAKKDLEKADHDFGGHRVNAIKAIDHAIEQLEKCLKFDKR
jgi:transcription elongation GreA/GreB family factor